MRIALLQMTSGIDPAANCAAIINALGQAKAAGADLLSTPEMALLLDSNRARAADHIVPEADNRWLENIRNECARLGIWLHLGSIAVADGASGKWANRCFLINDKGAIVARYDKIHLFDVNLASGESWRESNAYVAGAHAVVADTPWGTVGLSICYDLRFPALFAALSEAGAQILFVPASFTVPTGQAHWHLLLRARAIENACFVVATAQSGTHQDGRATFGHSLVIAPWGEVQCDMGEGAGLAVVDLNLDEVAKARGQVPVLANRRKFANPARS